MDETLLPSEGAALPFPGPKPLSPSQEAQPEPVPLRLVLDPGGAHVELTQADVIVGRHSSADVRLPLPDVSRRHCRFHYDAGGWQVIDLDSLNGVFVNGEAVEQAPVRTGDRVKIGGFTFRAEVAPADLPDTLTTGQAGRLRLPPRPDHRKAS